jgi:hypothetical protein
MAGHSRSKNGVASLAYVPAISLRWALSSDDRDARVKPAHDAREGRRSKDTNPDMILSDNRFPLFGIML